MKPSVMESLICRKLKRCGVEFYREVYFEGLINPETKCKLRYDFYIPNLDLLIEYDGIGWHNSKKVICRDNIKNKFAATNNIKLVRISGLNNLNEYFRVTFGDTINDTIFRKPKVKKVKPPKVKKKKSPPSLDSIASKSLKYYNDLKVKDAVMADSFIKFLKENKIEQYNLIKQHI